MKGTDLVLTHASFLIHHVLHRKQMKYLSHFVIYLSLVVSLLCSGTFIHMNFKWFDACMCISWVNFFYIVLYMFRYVLYRIKYSVRQRGHLTHSNQILLSITCASKSSTSFGHVCAYFIKNVSTLNICGLRKPLTHGYHQ